MINYFKDCKTLDEAKKLYWDLAKELHPDKNGSTQEAEEAFKAMANQFEAFKPETEKFEGESAKWNAAEYAHIIEQLLKIPNIVVEICGSWIWLSGETKPNKEQIKAINTGDSYKRGWSKNKEMWYFSPAGYRRKSGGEYSMDEIRANYGSKYAKGNQDDEQKTKSLKKKTDHIAA